MHANVGTWNTYLTYYTIGLYWRDVTPLQAQAFNGCGGSSPGRVDDRPLRSARLAGVEGLVMITVQKRMQLVFSARRRAGGGGGGARLGRLK